MLQKWSLDTIWAQRKQPNRRHSRRTRDETGIGRSEPNEASLVPWIRLRVPVSTWSYKYLRTNTSTNVSYRWCHVCTPPDLYTHTMLNKACWMCVTYVVTAANMQIHRCRVGCDCEITMVCAWRYKIKLLVSVFIIKNWIIINIWNEIKSRADALQYKHKVITLLNSNRIIESSALLQWRAVNLKKRSLLPNWNIYRPM